jgi:diamine N-acetyltransferase
MKSEQIYLRILEEEDIEKTTRWINSPEISDIMGYLPVKSLAQQKKWFAHLSDDNSRFVFAICRISDSEHIGNVGIGNIDYINRHCMFNIFIVDKNERSKGIGTEVTRLALDFAFNRLNMNKVYLQTSERFIEANNMYKKLGFKMDGKLRAHYFTSGGYEDKIIYSILRKEYEENQ